MKRSTYKVICLGDRHTFIKLSARIAIITAALKRAGKGRRMAKVVSAYFGFQTQDQAQAFVTGLRRRFPRAMCQIRQSQRLTTPIEVKVRSFDGLESFAWTLLSQQETAAPEISPEEAKASIFPIPVEVDRFTAPSYRSQPQKFGRGKYAAVSID